MTDLTPTQKSLLDALFKDFRGDVKELLGEHKRARISRGRTSRGQFSHRTQKGS